MAKNPEQRRQQAIKRYLAGEKIDDLCRAMACSKSWLYKWLHRYNTDNPNWALSQASRPLTQPSKTTDAIAQHILQLKKTLPKNGQPVGAKQIQQALKQQDITPLPAIRTIYRILQRYEKEVK